MSDRRRSHAERVYDALLRVFPADFRDRFRLQLTDLFRDAHCAARSRGRLAVAAFWTRIVADAVVTGIAERARRRPHRGIEGGNMDRWRSDIRYALRAIRRRPSVSLLIIATLALGIGANTAIFSVVNTVLLRRLPYTEPDRLVRISEHQRQRGDAARPVPPGNFFDWKPRAASFQDVAWSRDAMFNLTGDQPPETIIGYRFSANMLQVLGVAPQLGRGFTAADDVAGAAKVVLLSHKLWQRRFAGDRAIVGRTLTVNGEPHVVIGVMPPPFEHPSGTEMWAPLALPAPVLARRDVTVLRLIGRLKPGVSRERAEAELNALYRDIGIRHPDTAAGLSVRLTPLGDAGDARPLLAILFGGVGFVLLIACANVANLLLADAAARRREFVVRAALGASRSRVVRQMLSESLLLAVAGGALGALVTWWTRDGLLALFPANIANLNLPRVERIDVSAAVFAFAFVVSVATGMLFGLLPAWHASRLDLHEGLKEGDRGGTPSRRTHAALVVAEVALSIVLLAGALLMARSFVRLQQQRLGFEPERVLSGRLMLPRYRYDSAAKVRAFTAALVQRLETIPGVEAAGVTNYLPLSGWWGDIDFRIEGAPEPQRGAEPSADLRVASEQYFRSMGMVLVDGRGFTSADNENAARVLMVNQTFAKRYFGGAAVGRRVRLDPDGTGSRAHEIVGVIADVKSFGLEDETHAELFVPSAQLPSPLVAIALRTPGNPAALAGPLREAVWSVDRDQPITHLMPMSALAAESLAFRRVGMRLAGGFALVALVLAAIGIYGVVSYSVSRRTKEIGIRVALGATRLDLSRLVLRESLMTAGLGVVIGVAAALALSRFLRSILYDVRPADPLTYLMVSAILLAVAFLAAWLPARRASRVDPLTALRIE